MLSKYCETNISKWQKFKKYQCDSFWKAGSHIYVSLLTGWLILLRTYTATPLTFKPKYTLIRLTRLSVIVILYIIYFLVSQNIGQTTARRSVKPTVKIWYAGRLGAIALKLVHWTHNCWHKHHWYNSRDSSLLRRWQLRWKYAPLCTFLFQLARAEWC